MQAATSSTRCSTPEGIEAGSRSAARRRRAGRGVLNARRHRSGIEGAAVWAPLRGLRVLNARRHRSGIEELVLEARPLAFHVLNARRHRSGIERTSRSSSNSLCSRAQRPKASKRDRGPALDEGAQIGRAQRPKASKRDRAVAIERDRAVGAVLNARRHRSGIEGPRSYPQAPKKTVLNARRHRSGIESSGPAPTRSTIGGAQRPKASKRDRAKRSAKTPERCSSAQRPKASKRDRDEAPERVERLGGVLNARRHRSGIEQLRARVLSFLQRCSTPEGIEAGSRG